MLSPESLALLQASVQERGYCTLAHAITPKYEQLLSDSYALLMQESLEILSLAAEAGKPLAEFYKESGENLIVVPESNASHQICRFEFISNRSEGIRGELIPYFQRLLFSMTGSGFKLFKDKCNVKNPGGGAFGCHQDYPAYADFPAPYHLTIAIFLDPPSRANGCLEMARNWRAISDDATTLDQDYPGKLIFKRDRQSGDVLPEITEQFEWEQILTGCNDIVLFNSFVPHRSSTNASNGSRRAFFFTFTPESSGDHYGNYYRAKRQAYDNPTFHLSTPTDRGL